MAGKNMIAKVDYLDFVSGNSEKRQNFIKEFGDSFSRMGFAIVANHGVTKELRDELFEVAIKFFDKEDALKIKYEDLSNAGQRGYISKNRESAKGQKVPDLKEFYHIGQTVTDGDPIKVTYPDNIWPDEIPGFKEVCQKVYQTFEQTGKNLLSAIALYLNLQENYFDDKVHNGNSVLRLLHYYPLENVDNVPAGAVRAAAHGDINLITLLMGANAAGLQAQTLDGDWVDVNPAPNEIVINIGDMLARLTNDQLRSTIHRVINPVDKELLKKPRYSTPFFLHPRADMDLTCLPGSISSGRPKKYENVTAGEFLKERLIELGLKK
jgi:isopenicillin N synthase-like dioxygenase